ncbi:MAG TPA: PfkB family carbohydrate kinase [Candidatus Gastranaerophilaceae bacterium]|nr:PfkB family carbohydrate kinase [Candidatus Gastranaerophilaceae bacterium]HPT41133.1 PfkB family carbohydrate kinase [Candidatus Gastranaerophilaceae bacterium]
MDVDKNKLIECIKNLRLPKVLVVGDLALDEMIYGDTERISREAPVLILQHTHTKLILGGASNAANNASVINGGKVGVIGVLGEDYQAEQLICAFHSAKIDTKYLVKDKNRKTTTKTRISGSCSQSITQQIVRVDRQTNTFLSEDTEKKVIHNLEHAIPEYDAIIISDYHIGSLTQKVIEKAIEIANKHNKIIVADAQKNLENYKDVTSMTPNLPDTQKFVGFEVKDDVLLEKAGRKLLEVSGAKSVLITCGSEGMVVFNENGEMTKIPVFNKSEVFDVTGAGDTVTAIFTMALASGAQPKYAAIIGNIAASIVVRHFGCATTTVEEILENLEKIAL